MRTIKRNPAAAIALLLTSLALAGCGSAGGPGEIHVVSREDGSGTRSAFVALFGVEETGASGQTVDRTKPDAAVTNSTAVMMTSIAGDVNGIGYLSLSALQGAVKAVQIDGAEATAENIQNGRYKVFRPFFLVTGKAVNRAARDFIGFILSAEGQSIAERERYIAAAKHAEPYRGSGPAGKIVVAGSSSVAPVMESLKEAYEKVNPRAAVELQTSDSTTGIHSVRDGICDIGMASRALKDAETAAGLHGTAIALDGIAVIVHRENPVDNLTREQVRSIFTGETTDWSALQ